MQELLSGPVEKLGWEEKANDTHFDTLLRPSLFYLSIKLDLFDAKEFAFNSIEVKSPEEIPANMRSAILAAVAREDSSYYKQYWKWYTEAKSAQTKLS